MDYMQQNPYTFAPQPQPQFFYSQAQYPSYVTHHPQQPVDEFYMPYPGAEYSDFIDAGMMHDEASRSQEVSTRPRLTKEQAEVLEAHFQANHKPSSQVKRELAIQTGLEPNRVANWFQNRRAKAKQQRRQEEYEAQNAPSNIEPTDAEDFDDEEDMRAARSSNASRSEAVSPTDLPVSPTKASSTTTTADSNSDEASAAQTPPTPVQVVDNSKEASWNSLQRALGRAKAAQAYQPGQPPATMSLAEGPAQPAASQLPLRLNNHHQSPSASYVLAWQSQHATAMPYPSPITLQDTSFDFGFDTDLVEQPSLQDSTIGSSTNYAQDSYVVTPEDYREPLATPKGTMHDHHDLMAALPSPGFAMPSYPGSRRPSATDDLSANFGNVALAGTPPNFMHEQYSAETICPPPSSSIDLAARRKRPRPAALTSDSLRSRSYGAVTSVSPTFRQGVMSPHSPHSVRHVKSAGQIFRYAGIRKASSAQRSPMCASTFAEAEALRQLMAQQGLATTPLTELPEPSLSPDLSSHGVRMPDPEQNPYFLQNLEMPAQYQMQAPQNLSITTAAPPITPLMANFMSRGLSQQSLMPPASAPPQYATFPDYTPPYSAGPLTNSSWSDAPMTSPDISSFPLTYISSFGYPQHCDDANGPFQQYVLRSDNKSEVDFDSHVDHKKTEFYIQEFPNQKEEHASVAQLLAQQKPKNYVFANTAPQDYNGT